MKLVLEIHTKHIYVGEKWVSQNKVWKTYELTDTYSRNKTISTRSQNWKQNARKLKPLWRITLGTELNTRSKLDSMSVYTGQVNKRFPTLLTAQDFWEGSEEPPAPMKLRITAGNTGPQLKLGVKKHVQIWELPQKRKNQYG